MATAINFDEYDGMYKRIINSIELDMDLADDTVDGSYKILTSVTKPLTYVGNSLFGNSTLLINHIYFNEHKEEMLSLITETLKSTRKDEFKLTGDEMLTEEAIKALASNPMIKTAYLDSGPGLSSDEIRLLSESNLESVSCVIDYDEYPELLYEYFHNIKSLNYPKICESDIENFGKKCVDLVVGDELSPDELDRLKKLFEKYPQESVYIEFNCEKQINEILSIVNSKEIVVRDNKHWQGKDYEVFNQNYDNIMIEIEEEEFSKTRLSPKNLIEKEKILNLIIDDVKSLELSPLEQYMYLYDVTKMLKEYKEEPVEEENDRVSRDVAFVLFNDYMVCVGYALLLKELVEKLDNPDLTVAPYSCTIEEDAIVYGHRKCLVKIKDEKYGVDGIFISDPTWDSISYYNTYINKDGELIQDFDTPVAHLDYYNHFLMTKEEMMDEDVEYRAGDVTDVLFNYADRVNSSKIKDFIYSETDEIIKQLNSKEKMTREEIATEIASIKQQPISTNILVSAIRTLYSKIYSADEQQIENIVKKTMEINRAIQEKHFSSTKDKFNYSEEKSY